MVQEIGSLLNFRDGFSGRIKENNEITGEKALKNSELRASLVILWGLLIYPLLDPTMKQSKKKLALSLEEVYQAFKLHLGTKKKWEITLSYLRRYDYIRMCKEGRVTAGTRLWTAVDGAKMYTEFRTSVLARQLNLAVNLTETNKEIQASTSQSSPHYNEEKDEVIYKQR